MCAGTPSMCRRLGIHCVQSRTLTMIDYRIMESHTTINQYEPTPPPPPPPPPSCHRGGWLAGLEIGNRSPIVHVWTDGALTHSTTCRYHIIFSAAVIGKGRVDLRGGVVVACVPKRQDRSKCRVAETPSPFSDVK